MFFDRPQSDRESGERALLVHVEFTGRSARRKQHILVDADLLIEEFEHLIASAGYEQATLVRASRQEPQPRTYVGAGKVEEIQAALKADATIGLVVFNHELSPAQGRNLEELFECRVQTRTELILDVFASRAGTHEGKLQVELAQLEHTATRLVRGWTHLDRQKGGIGMRGAGETQLEMDQRMLGIRTRKIRDRLERVRARRGQSRRRRRRNEVPTVVLVGYTNAGKSSLFNRLTEAEVLAADQLFATLDPTTRRVLVPGVGEVMLVDTVGFIRDLPHELVQAFRATLEEVADADLLLHVMDVVADDRDDRRAQVLEVLEEIEADQVPALSVYNKSDLLDLGLLEGADWQLMPADLPVSPEGEAAATPPSAGAVLDDKVVPRADQLADRYWNDADALRVSAHTGLGVDELLRRIGESLRGAFGEHQICLEPRCGRLRADLYRRDAVISEQARDDGSMELTVRLAPDDLARLVDEPGVALLGGADSLQAHRGTPRMRDPSNLAARSMAGRAHGVE